MTAPTKSLTFPQTHRMKTPAEFERCYARKRSASDGVLIVYACENNLTHPRLGCSVSRKVGNAVVRNRYKRLFREGFRLSQHDLPQGVDLILIPRPGPYPTVDTVRASLVKLATQAARRLTGPPPANLTKGKGAMPLPSPRPRGEGGGASPPGDGARSNGVPSLASPGGVGSPLTRLEDSPPSPRGRGEGKDSSSPTSQIGNGSASGEATS